MRAREQKYFERNRDLALAVKQRDEWQCRACGMVLEEHYGSVGREFIECHHLKAFGERGRDAQSVTVETRLDEAVSLCPNCHRMVHRKRPALDLERLRRLLRRNRLARQRFRIIPWFDS